MANLFDLTADYLQILDMMDDPELDQQTLADTMEGIEGALEDKFDRYVYVYKQEQGDIDVLNETIKQLQARKKSKEENLKKLGEAAVLVTAGGVLAVALYCWEYDNVLYTLLNQVHRATESYVTNLVSRVESCDGYTYGIPVVIVGSFPEGRYNTDIEGYNWVKSSSSLTSSVIPLNKHIYYYLNDCKKKGSVDLCYEICLNSVDPSRNIRICKYSLVK